MSIHQVFLSTGLVSPRQKGFMKMTCRIHILSYFLFSLLSLTIYETKTKKPCREIESRLYFYAAFLPAANIVANSRVRYCWPFAAKVGKNKSLWYNSPPSVVPFAQIMPRNAANILPVPVQVDFDW